jgi:DNA repair exonuclease SbcCD ATPase subunit
MISLDTITLRNFLSVGAVFQTIVLSGVPFTLILGENLDVGGENSRNGAGKSTLLQAISYVLFDKPLTKIKMDNLINATNAQDMELSIDFHRDGVPYRIERGRKPNHLRFLVGVDQQDYAQGENSRTQVEIERIIGMSHTMFLHIVALNTFTTPFLKMRPADQREVIEELMGISQISQLAEHLKTALDENKNLLRNEEATVGAITAANQRIEQVIIQARHQADEWTLSHQHMLHKLDQQAAQQAEIDIDAELLVFDQIDAWTQNHRVCHEQIGTAGALIDSLELHLGRSRKDLLRYQNDAARDSGEVGRLRQQVIRLREDADRSITPQVDRLVAHAVRQRYDAAAKRSQCECLIEEREIITVQLKSPDVHRCSVCKQGLTGTDHLATVIAALQHKADDLTQAITQAAKQAAQYEGDAVANERDADNFRLDHVRQTQMLLQQSEALELEISDIEQQAIQQRSAAQAQVKRMQIEMDDLQIQVDQQYSRLDTLADQSAQYGSKPLSFYGSRDALWRVRSEHELLLARLEIEHAKRNPIDDKIGSLTSTLSVIDHTLLNALIDESKHQQFLYKLLTSKDSFIRKRIIDQNLPCLNAGLSRYLQRLGLPHEVRFLADLTVEISLLGRDFDFEQLSRGEMNRLILATSFSFRELWQSLNLAINLTFLDEYIDQGIDQAGVDATVAILQEMAAQTGNNVFLISHREELKSQIDELLLAVKENQFTTFVSSSELV